MNQMKKGKKYREGVGKETGNNGNRERESREYQLLNVSTTTKLNPTKLNDFYTSLSHCFCIRGTIQVNRHLCNRQ